MKTETSAERREPTTGRVAALVLQALMCFGGPIAVFFFGRPAEVCAISASVGVGVLLTHEAWKLTREWKR